MHVLKHYVPMKYADSNIHELIRWELLLIWFFFSPSEKKKKIQPGSEAGFTARVINPLGIERLLQEADSNNGFSLQRTWPVCAHAFPLLSPSPLPQYIYMHI